jgi:hypothetical protein
MIKLKVPTQKRFDLVVSEETEELQISEIQETAQGYVSFKQATTGEVEIRTGILQNRRWKQENGSIMLFDDFNVDFLARMEVRLTMTGTDITFEDGVVLEFKNNKLVSESQFNKWWDQLPFQWARKLHSFCLELNPMWDMSKRE